MQLKASECDDVLVEACSLYRRGKYQDCLRTIQTVPLEKFDVKEWACENITLLCKVKVGNGSKSSNFAVSEQFQLLWDKVRGLPSQEQSFPLIVCVGLNHCLLLLSGDKVDSCYQSASILTDNIVTASEVFSSKPANLVPTLTTCNREMLFSTTVIKNTLQAVEILLSQSLPSHHYDLMALNCLLLAILWMSQHQVDLGFELLGILKNDLEKRKEYKIEQTTEIFDPTLAKNIFPLTLLEWKNKYGMSGLKAAVVFLMSLHIKSCKNDDQKALDLIDSCSDDCFYLSYLKGLIVYNMEKITDALSCFCHCNTITDITESNKASALTMVGLCLEKQNKHHTAIVTFKEALSNDFYHLDSLFYIAQQQQTLGKHDAEIQTLKHLCKALIATKNSKSSKSLLQGPFFPFINNLQGSTITYEYACYWLGKRCLELQRFIEASEACLDVIASINASKMSCSCPPLPPVTQLYRDCAYAMLKAGKNEDCVTVCDRALIGRERVDVVNEVKNTGKRLRTVQSLANQDLDVVELLLCKSLALSCLGHSLMSLQTLQRIFDDIADFLSVIDNEDLDDSHALKRRKIESNVGSSIESVLSDCIFDIQNENTPLLRIKSEAHMVRAQVLQAMNQDKHALEELYLSVVYCPDSISAIYHYTKLLSKLGLQTLAAKNWIKYQQIQRDVKTHTNTKCERRYLPFLFHVTDTEVQEMDRQAAMYF